MIGRLTTAAVLIALCASASAGGHNNKLRADAARKLQVCAASGERSQECGATNTARPEFCCEGLVCTPGASVTCVEAGAVTCAEAGTKAIECGIMQTNRPDLCCEGLECDAVTKSCTDPLSPDFVPVTPAPTVTPFTPGDPNCAGDGERAQDCGAASTSRPQSCCTGFICNPRPTLVNCIPDPAVPTQPAPVEPTASPVETVETVEPTPSTVDLEPTASPVESVEPTPAVDGSVEPTPAVGSVEPTPMTGSVEPTPMTGSVEPTPSPVEPDGTLPPPPIESTEAPTDADMAVEPTAQPTEDPTPPPTDDPIIPPPSSASSFTIQLAALAACLFAPLLIL